MEKRMRPAAVAGTFYPASVQALTKMVDGMLSEARAEEAEVLGRLRPKALIVPHAGLIYSGPIAASAYALLAPIAATVERVVIVGPAHHVYVGGLAAGESSAMETPLGEIQVDNKALAHAPSVERSERAHAPEHSIEVQLPFLQRILPHATVVPLLASDATAEQVGQVLEQLWGGPETLIVVSSDLSHYLSYDAARVMDGDTATRIVALDPRPLDHRRACGAAGINGLLWVARRKGLRPRLLDLRSSGDTAGTRERVVGYGAFSFEEAGHAS